MNDAKLLYLYIVFWGVVFILYQVIEWVADIVRDPHPEESETHSATRYGYYDAGE